MVTSGYYRELNGRDYEGKQVNDVEKVRYIDPEDYDNLMTYVRHLEKVLDAYHLEIKTMKNRK